MIRQDFLVAVEVWRCLMHPAAGSVERNAWEANSEIA